MAETSSIEWTDATWQIVTGCTIDTPGCTNCYAMKLAGTRLQHHPSRAGLTVDSKAGPVWNGEVRLNKEWLTQPLQWKRPRRIFVCAHGDLFAESVLDEWIDRVFAVMALAPQHTFQVLTKRAGRMLSYMSDPTARDRVDAVMNEIAPDHWHAREVEDFGGWPLPNVWLGISAEDQTRADERVPDLLATPAAVRFVSAEPLLGPIDFRDRKIEAVSSDLPRDGYEACCWDWLEGKIFQVFGPQHFTRTARLDWIIVGGESGPKARPMHPAWAQSIRDQCAAAGVAFFHKQNGEWAARGAKGISFPEATAAPCIKLTTAGDNDSVLGAKGGEPVWLQRIGKKAAGRLLDGVEHNGMPEARHGL